MKAGARVLPRESVEMGVDDGKSRQGKWFVPDDSQDWTIHFRSKSFKDFAFGCVRLIVIFMSNLSANVFRRWPIRTAKGFQMDYFRT